MSPKLANKNAADVAASLSVIARAISVNAAPASPTTSDSAQHTSALMEDHVGKIIDVMNRLRNTGLGKQLQLPRICVVGAQSAGKSSVLEAVVGIDFLPKAAGLCTRRPLEIRMRRDLTIPESDPPFAFFVDSGKDGPRITDFKEVTQGIISRTNEVAGEGCNIVDDPIVLTIHQRNCHDLTLIDLPGVTRVATQGQDDNIEKVTRDMSLRYIKEERTIILAVLPGNNDVTNADSLQLARGVDKEGIRTIGVVTKIDLIPSGTDPTDILQGRTVPLLHGYVGVLNRSQADLHDGVSIKQSLANEAAFVRNHAVLSLMQSNLLGIPTLRAKLSRHLSDAISAHLPAIRKEVGERLAESRKKLLALGNAPRNRQEREVLLSTIRSEIGVAAEVMLCYGTLPTNTAHRADLKPFLTVAKFRDLYVKLYDKKIAASSPPALGRADCDAVDGAYFSVEEARDIVAKSNVVLLPTIFTEQCFRNMCSTRLRFLLQPAEDLIADVDEAVQMLVEKIIKHLPSLAAFNTVRDAAISTSLDFVVERREETLRFVRELLECELESMYAFNIDITSQMKEAEAAIPEVPQNASPAQLLYLIEYLKGRLDDERTREADERRRIVKFRDLAIEYLEDTRKRLRDAIPRVIHQRFVCAVASGLVAHLSKYLTAEKVEPHMAENYATAVDRQRFEETIKTMEESQAVLRAFL